RDRVVEVDGSRIARRDSLRLEAGLREDQSLRIRIDAEPVEQRRQVTERAFAKFELRGAGGELAIETRGRIVEDGFEVAARGEISRINLRQDEERANHWPRRWGVADASVTYTACSNPRREANASSRSLSACSGAVSGRE